MTLFDALVLVSLQISDAGRTMGAPGGIELVRFPRGGGNRNVYTPITGNPSYALVFDDEFNGSAVDTTQWLVANQPGSGSYVNNQFDPAQVTVSGGFIRLNVVQSGTTPPYNSGFITTGTASGNFNYGPNTYIEARIRMPVSVAGASHGAVPAFWGNGFFTGGPNNDPPELDIVEWHGSFPTETWPLAAFQYPPTDGYTYIPNTESPFDGNNPFPTLGVDWGAGFHVIGMFWTTTSVVWYFDGAEMGRLTNGVADWSGHIVTVPTSPICIILNNSEDLNSEVPDGFSVYPQTLTVDYVHVYTQGGTPITPQANYGGPGDSVGSGN